MCGIAGCDRPVLIKSRQLCRAHYKRLRRHGDPTAGTAYTGEPLEQRIWRGIAKTDGGCWEWTRARSSSGYGLCTTPRGPTLLAHRAVYEVLVGAIPDGMQLDHLCKNKGCVNPDHLEVVTRSENVRRGWPDRKERASCLQ